MSTQAHPPEKPLHVRVAEALGWTQIRETRTLHQVLIAGEWRTPVQSHGLEGCPPCGTETGAKFVPRYDTDWWATGPLLEKHNIDVGAYNSEFKTGLSWAVWQLNDENNHFEEEGQTYLIAVCKLLIALGAAGKLKP